MSMRIDCIYIVGWRGDLRFTQCCVASIRHWHPTIDICLIKDQIGGEYDTAALEQSFNVRLFDAAPRRYGWGVAKLEPLFLSARHRCLIIDSDVVFVGSLLEALERTDEDFVLVEEDHPPGKIKQDYFDRAALERLYPWYSFPGWVSNTGQFVGTAGILRREDFLPFLSLAEPLVVSQGGVYEHSGIHLPKVVPPLREREGPFAQGEQGALNFVLQTKLQQAQITLRRLSFMRWPPDMKPEEIDIARLGDGPGYPFLLHWAGPKTRPFEALPMSHVLAYFDTLYRDGVAS